MAASESGQGGGGVLKGPRTATGEKNKNYMKHNNYWVLNMHTHKIVTLRYMYMYIPEFYRVAGRKGNHQMEEHSLLITVSEEI